MAAQHRFTRGVIPLTIALGALFAPAVTGCALHDAPPAVHRADSAGVEIVTSDAPQRTTGAPWRIDSVPVIDIGGDNDSTEIDNAPTVLLLPAGGLVVEGAGTFKLLFFDSTGALTRATGRKGQGPGEFERVKRMRYIADSVMVWDSQLNRITRLGPRGELGGTLNPAFAVGNVTRMDLEGRWSDGQWLFVEGRTTNSSQPIGMTRGTVAAVRLGADAAGGTLMGPWPGTEMMAVTSTQIVAVLDVPYGRTTTMHWAARGFWVGTANEPRIDAYNEEGKLVRSVRWHAAPVAVEGSELAAWRKSSRLSPPDVPASVAEPFNAAAEKARFPETRPPYGKFLVDGDGNLWAARVPKWDVHDARQEWDVLTAAGEWLGVVVFPARFTPSEIREGRALGLWHDESDVTHVRVYRVVK